MPTVTADQLYRFIETNTEEIDGQAICRASLVQELTRLGIEPATVRQQLRIRLVKELEARGLVKRVNPRSRWLVVLNPDRHAPTSQTSHDRFVDRMSYGDKPDAIEILAFPRRRYGCKQHRTETRLARLKDYMDSNVLAGKQFICGSWGECEGSSNPDCSFTEGQLSHLGKHFDLLKDGQPIRVVVVGQEVGASGHPRTTLPERYRTIHDGSGMNKRFVSDGDHKSRNPHMKGTTLALRAIFGTGSGTERDGEFINVDDRNVHLFDCFALVNRLICSAHLTGTSTGKSTRTMLRNCERHFQATLEILEPTIVVTQGIKVWRWSKNVLVPVKQPTENLFQCELAGRRVMVAAFTHPSAWGPDRWDSPQSTYFKETVRPTLERAMKAS